MEIWRSHPVASCLSAEYDTCKENQNDRNRTNGNIFCYCYYCNKYHDRNQADPDIRKGGQKSCHGRNSFSSFEFQIEREIMSKHCSHSGINRKKWKNVSMCFSKNQPYCQNGKNTLKGIPQKRTRSRFDPECSQRICRTGISAPHFPDIDVYKRQDVLRRNNVPYKEVVRMEEALPDLDILYMTRVQKERFFNEEDYVRMKDFYILDKKKMELASKDMLVPVSYTHLDVYKRQIL